MRNAHAYKTYLAYATRAATPKKARKFKKPTSPSKKRTLIIEEEEEPELAKKKKTPTITDKSKGIDFLSKVDALEATQLKKPKGKSVNTNEGTRLKPEVPNVPMCPKLILLKARVRNCVRLCGKFAPQLHESAGGLPQNKKTSLSHTAPLQGARVCNFCKPLGAYLHDETNDESNDVDEEEYDRIDKELYGDVNVRLIDVEQDDEGEEDADMTDVAHVHVGIKRLLDDLRVTATQLMLLVEYLVYNSLDYENQETNDDEEESDDEFLHTPPNYVPTDDEMNDESNDVDEEEYDRIDKELYGDVNIRLTDAEQDDRDEEDANMTDVAHVQVEQTQE
ncbi:hypothetical protein Tco_1265565 [Tanacetum coccineum]